MQRARATKRLGKPSWIWDNRQDDLHCACNQYTQPLTDPHQMKRWLRVLIAACEVLVVLLAVYVEPSQCVRGKLQGEAFFEGKPTSWWRRELTQWHVIRIQWSGGPNCIYWRSPSRWEEWSGSLWGKDATRIAGGGRPALLQGSTDALPVLRELRNDPSPEIRELVEIAFEQYVAKSE